MVENIVLSDRLATFLSHDRQTEEVLITAAWMLALVDMHEAFAAAVEQWRHYGVPENPRAWLVSTGRFKAIDTIRRSVKAGDVREGVARRLEELSSVNAERRAREIEDDRLRLVFTCCHPSLSSTAQVAMTKPRSPCARHISLVMVG